MDIGLIIIMVVVFGLLGYTSGKLPPVFGYVLLGITVLMILIMLAGMLESLGYPAFSNLIQSYPWVYAITVPYGAGLIIGKIF